MAQCWKGYLWPLMGRCPDDFRTTPVAGAMAVGFERLRLAWCGGCLCPLAAPLEELTGLCRGCTRGTRSLCAFRLALRAGPARADRGGLGGRSFLRHHGRVLRASTSTHSTTAFGVGRKLASFHCGHASLRCLPVACRHGGFRSGTRPRGVGGPRRHWSSLAANARTGIGGIPGAGRTALPTCSGPFARCRGGSYQWQRGSALGGVTRGGAALLRVLVC